MINVSKEFQLLMNERSDFKQNAEITFADGSVLDLTEKDFCISNNNVVDASDTNGIPLGIAVCRNIQIELMNDDDRFSTYDFFGAVIRLYLTFQLSETVERIEYGTFTVLTPETYGETVIISALDDMYKADKEYTTTLAFPATIGAMLCDACVTLGISQGTTTFLNEDFVVNEKPEDLTFRQLFGYIAMIAGGNVRIDRTGRLRVITYDFANMDSIYDSVLNGGAYKPWDNLVNIDGGSFSPWNGGDNVDGGVFGDRNNFHVLGNWSNLKVDTDDVVITGMQTKYRDEENEEHTVLSGVEGYVLSIKNPLISGKEAQALDLIGNVMIGGRFRQFSGDIVANPTCEFMDPAVVLDRKGNIYISFLTDVDFRFFGFTSIRNSAEPTLRNSSKRYSESAQAFIQAKELVLKEKTAREQAVEQLAKDLSNSSGLYVTTENQEDGSKIYYMHDKPTLSESMIVWKLTSLAFGISTDGGKTYPYGFTVDGETVTRLLYAEGIDVKNLAGETITGKNIITPSQDGRNIKLYYGGMYFYHDENMVGGLSVNFYNDNPGVFLHNQGGNFVGIAIGEQADGSDLTFAYKASPYETIKNQFFGGAKFGYSNNTIINDYSIESNYSTGSTLIAGPEISVSGISANTKIEDGAIRVTVGSSNYLDIDGKKLTSYGGTSDYSILEGKKITSFGSAYNYTEIEGAEIYLYNGTTSNLTIASDSILLNGGYNKTLTILNDSFNFDSTFSIKQGATSLIEFTSSNVTIKGSNTYLGTSSGYLGFFGTTTKSTKKSVTTITSTSTADVSTVATKLNEVINALKAYNLI